MTENDPFLRLAPIKMEQMYIEPDVYVFHGVISDDEIEHIKDRAKPRVSYFFSMYFVISYWIQVQWSTRV